MDYSQIHFAHPYFLLAAIAIPVVWALYLIFFKTSVSRPKLEQFIDSHLLPYLLINKSTTKSVWKPLLWWSVVWALLTLALAGPRWNFREMDTFSKDQNLVILLDLSESMNVADIKPTRLVRAKQKIEDLLNLSRGVKVGLIAFAADPHIITPITDDKESIRHLLPTLDTDLVYVKGSRLAPALEMASSMLAAEAGTNKAILVISDGGFEDASALITAKKIGSQGILIHTMGMGTAEGGPVQDHAGNVLKKNGNLMISKLEKERLKEISTVGKGRDLALDYTTRSEEHILNDLEKRAEAQMALGKKNRVWEEHFYLFILPVLPFLLWWFRRGYVFAWLLLFSFPTYSLEAAAADYFKNNEQLGKDALERGDFETAGQIFQDPYRKGVAYYKAGNYAEAENFFRQSTRPEMATHAMYNLGNTLAQQQKIDDAITAYEEVLEQQPDHARAKENLELLKKMRDQQQQNDQQQSQGDEQSENSDQQNSKDSSGQQPENKQQSSGSDKSEQQKKQDGQSEESNKQQSKGSENSEQQQKQDRPREETNKKNPSDSDPQQDKSQDAPQQNEQAKQDQKKEQQTNDSSSAPAQAQPKANDEGKKEDAHDVAKQGEMAKTQKDHDADLLLNRIESDPKKFMKNKFYIESKKSGTAEGIDPW